MNAVLPAPNSTARRLVPSAGQLPVYLRSAEGPSAAYMTAKRALDVLTAGTMMIVLSPLFLVVSLLIKLTDGGPVFFRQERVGVGGRRMAFYKFRSMVPNADALKDKLAEQNKYGKNAVIFKMCRDPRVTWIGRILRKTSVDELPQLWNVLKGEMTLVGPRPAVVKEVLRYNARERKRLAAVPGLTCIWQVSGRSDLDFQQQVELDLRYIRERSLWLDIKLLILTVPAVLSGKGAVLRGVRNGTRMTRMKTDRREREGYDGNRILSYPWFSLCPIRLHPPDSRHPRSILTFPLLLPQPTPRPPSRRAESAAPGRSRPTPIPFPDGFRRR